MKLHIFAASSNACLFSKNEFTNHIVLFATRTLKIVNQSLISDLYLQSSGIIYKVINYESDFNSSGIKTFGIWQNMHKIYLIRCIA